MDTYLILATAVGEDVGHLPASPSADAAPASSPLEEPDLAARSSSGDLGGVAASDPLHAQSSSLGPLPVGGSNGAGRSDSVFEQPSGKTHLLVFNAHVGPMRLCMCCPGPLLMCLQWLWHALLSAWHPG